MSLTKTYPVLPLKNSVIFPGNIMPILVGRARSLALINDLVGGRANEGDGDFGEIVLLTQKKMEIEDPEPEDLYPVGTITRVLKIIHMPDGNATAVVQGLRRVAVVDGQVSENASGYLEGKFTPLGDEYDPADAGTQAAFLDMVDVSLKIVQESSDIPKETEQILREIQDPSEFCDFIAGNMDNSIPERYAMLAETSVKARIALVRQALDGQAKVAQVAAQIRESVLEDTDKHQKEFYLRQQLKAIKKQLGDDGDELDDLEHKISTAHLSEEAEKQARKQLSRLMNMQPTSSEYSVTYNYVETLLDIPWKVRSDDNYDLGVAQEILDEDHYGLDKIKDRLIEFLAVRQLNADMKGPILCLVGPAGVGKTSISKSIARTMGRKFQRISLGGVRDESEIRGHRRTYVGAMPGRIAKALMNAGTSNPVILLDEIDKVGQDFRGTPQDALLEVLDPAQNHTFSDHFLGIPLDLSKVIFIATANQLDTISAPLRDRMEIIEVPSYTSHEKRRIAREYLLPKQIKSHGISPSHLALSDESLDYIIDKYTREAGVRNLERRVADICRKVAVQVAKTNVRLREDFHVEVDRDFITAALGPEKYQQDVAQRVSIPGVSTGLAWTQAGGDILFVEATKMPGKGNLKLTGQLGDVMKESVEAALSYLRSNSEDFGLTPDFMEKADLHVHFPAGATPKDGPSAGITIFTAILSVMTGQPVRSDVAMTGEITLRGQILPVGGIREKATAAHRAGIKHVIMPEDCKKDLHDVQEEVKADVQFHFVSRVEELISLVFDHLHPQQPAASQQKPPAVKAKGRKKPDTKTIA